MHAGQGKTQVIGHLLQKYVSEGKTSCVVVPNKLLLRQAEALFKNCFASHLVSVVTASQLTSETSYDVYIYDEADDLINNYMFDA